MFTVVLRLLRARAGLTSSSRRRPGSIVPPAGRSWRRHAGAVHSLLRWDDEEGHRQAGYAPVKRSRMLRVICVVKGQLRLSPITHSQVAAVTTSPLPRDMCTSMPEP